MPAYQRSLQSKQSEQSKDGTIVFEQSQTALRMEKNSRAVIDSINSRCYSAATSLVATTYRSDIDDLSKTKSYSDSKKQFQQISQKHPEYHVEVVNVSADVDEESGYAIVYCLLSVTGRPANVRRQSVSVVEWMRRDGQWQYYNATVVRGQDGPDVVWHQ